MIFAVSPLRRNSVSMLGPSISGMMTSETIRSIAPPAFLDDLKRLQARIRLQHGP